MKFTLLTVSMMFLASSALSQHAHRSGPVSETGQSQFAAIAQIVTELRKAPDTDWSSVDIDALRAHLVDMDNVTTKAVVQKEADGSSITFTITGDATVAKSIQRMVLAHSPMLQKSTGWTVAGKARDDGATMILEVATADEREQVTALGFFGLMTIGAHHQQHHLMIARGHSPH